MKLTNYKFDELLNLSNRSITEQIDELCDRYDYFFLQTDGTYQLPNHDGHTHQSLKMLGELVLKWKEHKKHKIMN